MVSVREANEFGKQMIEQHIPGEGYTLTWDARQDRGGAANFRYKEIILSAAAVEFYDWEQVEELMIHEIAHVKSRHEQADHGPEWRRAVKEMGGTPSKLCAPFPLTELNITPTGVAVMASVVVTLWTVYGPVAGGLTIAGFGAWILKRLLRKSPAEERGLVMVDGEWV